MQARRHLVLMGFPAREDVAEHTRGVQDESPLFSVRHSACTLMAVSVIPGRDFAPRFASVSSTRVAPITGTCAASHSQMISSWISASRMLHGDGAQRNDVLQQVLRGGGCRVGIRADDAGHGALDRDLYREKRLGNDERLG
jgi:hypothetical protein